MENSLQQTLDRILSELKSDDSARCLSAIQELSTLTVSSNAIVFQLEKLALSADVQLREAALSALSLRTSQFVASQLATLSKPNRALILNEINEWQQDGLIEPHHAEVLRRHYDFDIRPITPAPQQPVQPTPEKIKTVEPEAQPVAGTPRPSLMQSLLSESSIKIYLYLGAFFVIASALILAAVVQAARLPILAAATLAFGGGALIIHKRLPQPSFALFIVFSFLLPIDANVLEEMINFREPALSIYWTVIFLMMAAIWAGSVWYYTSSFFSLVAFGALSLAFYRAAEIFQTEDALSILFGAFASLAGLLGVYLLKKWRSNRFALPVFLLAQLQVVGLLLTSLVLVVISGIFDSNISGGWWLIIALTWIAGSSFFVASDFLLPFLLFPWMAVAALLPIPWFVLNTFDVSQPIYAIGFWIWAAAFALVSESTFRFEKIRKYGWALLGGSAPLFFAAILIALDWDDPTLTFTLVAGAALVYAALHILRRRWYVWGAALLSALAAYYLIFTLPVVQKFDLPAIYQILGACVLLLFPELFAPPPLTSQNQTRLPMLVLGLLLSFACITDALALSEEPGRAAIVFLTFAILFTLHAFHFNQPRIGYAAVASEILTVIYALQYFDKDWWLPALTAVSILYFAAGFFLRRTNSGLKAWGPVLINSGLLLGAVLSLTAVLLEKEFAGWYIILIALLFAVEIFARPFAWFELAVEILLSLALFRILADFNPPHAVEHILFGISLIWLGGDLLFGRFVEKRLHRPLTLGVGYLFVAFTTVALFVLFDSTIPVFYYLTYALFFGLYAGLQREPRLGYFVTAFVPLAVIKLCMEANFDKLSFPLVALAVLYYAVGFWLRKNQNAKGWDIMLLNSALALGVIGSMIAPFAGGLDSAIPIAIAATLFAVEAFALRSVWWALPADGLYLMSYFVILGELNVDEPQFYSIGAALLGMLMHHLLTRAGSKMGAFIAGLLSQVVLLGTTYIQMVSTNQLSFFFVLFAQSMIVLVYGLIQRSRSMVITPIAFAVLGVVTVVYSALKGLSSVILVGCTGILLLLLGIGAVLLRERITRIGEQLSDWRP